MVDILILNTSKQNHYSNILISKNIFPTKYFEKKLSDRKKNQKYLNYHKKYLMFNVLKKLFEYFYLNTSHRLQTH